MTAARNYVFTLNAEVAAKGVFVGSVNIGAVLARSAGLRAMTSGGAALDPRYPVIDPDDVAEELWTLIMKRDRVEAILPPLSAA